MNDKVIGKFTHSDASQYYISILYIYKYIYLPVIPRNTGVMKECLSEKVSPHPSSKQKINSK